MTRAIELSYITTLVDMSKISQLHPSLVDVCNLTELHSHTR